MSNEVKASAVRLLALDGRDFPGTATSQLNLLYEIIRRSDFDNGADRPSRLCEHFELIGGTGMGGIFAIFFAIFRMTVAEAIKAHSLLHKQVFSSEAWTAHNTAQVQAHLESAIEEIGKLYDVDVSQPLLSGDTNACKAFVCTINPSNMSFPRLLRTYRVRDNSGPDCSIRDAFIAAIAGVPHIQPIELDLTEEFACATDRFGNPINQVLDETRAAFKTSQGVSCIVNIGAGHPGLLCLPSSSDSKLRSLEKLARDCEGRAEEVANRFSGINNLFFRLSVTHGLDNESQTHGSQSSVAAHTSQYLQQAQVGRLIDQVVIELKEQVSKVLSDQLSALLQRGFLNPSHCIPDRIHCVDLGLRKSIKRALPPRPAQLLGRDDQMIVIIEAILSKSSTVVLGTGGIGKTSLALTVLYDESVQSAFKSFYFVSCEGLSTIELLYAELSECIGIPTQQRDSSRPREQILDYLRKDQAVLCIDNFETLWDFEETRIRVQDALADFEQLDCLSLLVTIRGSKAPGPASRWCAISLDPLPKEDALSLFRYHSGCRVDDEFALKLVEAVERIPLAVQLLAAAANSPDENTKELWERWEESGTRAVSQGKGHRLLDLDTSIELSLNGPQLRKLFGVKATLVLLSLLPGGLNKQGEIFNFLKSSRVPVLRSLSESLHALTGASLAYMDSTEDRRYRLLAPISRYAKDNLLHTLSQSTKQRLVTAYLNFIKNCKPGNLYEHSTVRRELSNVHSILKYGFEEDTHPKSDELALAVCRQSEWMTFLRSPSDELLLRAIFECQMSPAVYGGCHETLGRAYVGMGRYGDAETSYFQLMEVCQQADDALGVGNSKGLLGDVYMRQNRLGEAEKYLHQAAELHQQEKDVLGEGSDRQSLGTVYLLQNQLEEAERSLIQAIELHQLAKVVLGEGFDRETLGGVYSRQNRLEEAEQSLLQAMELFQQVKDVLGEVLTGQELGIVYSRQGRLDEAEVSLLQAIKLHQQAKDVGGEGDVRETLGEVYIRQNRPGEAEECLHLAMGLHQQISNVTREGSHRSLLGYVYLQRNRLEEAEESLLQAVELHQQVNDVLGEGSDRQTLGRVYLRQNRLEEAEAFLLQAIELHQQAKDLRDERTNRLTLGKVYIRQNRFEEAQAIFP